MRAPNLRWWSITAIAVVVLGNSLVTALWLWAIFSTPAYTDARYIIEAGIAFMIGAATLLLALPFTIAGLVHRATRVASAVTLPFAFTPVPLGIILLHLLSHWRHITLSP